MAFSKQSTFGLCCILLFHSAIVLSLDSDCRHQEEKLAQLKAKFRAYQRTALVALKRHSAQQYEQRSPCPRSDNYRTTQKDELEQTTASGVESLRNKRNFQSLLDVVINPQNSKLSAHVPQSHVGARLNASLQFSCGSRGQGLSLCLWHRSINGQQNTVIMDEEFAERRDAISPGGIKYYGNGLSYGECGLEIGFVTDADIRDWTCTLITPNGQVFAGVVHVYDKENDIPTTEEEEYAETTWIPSDYTEDEVMATSEASASILQLDCGGVVRIPNEGVTYVEYKLGEQYDHNEFCLWVVSSIGASWTSLAVTVESSNFETGYDGLQAYNLKSAANPELERCVFSSGQSTCQLPNEVAFLAFSSDGSEAGTGFRLRLEPRGLVHQPVFSTFHINDRQGVVSYPARRGHYRNLERAAIVFQMRGPNRIELTRLQTEASYDKVHFFTIFPYQFSSDARLDGRYSGNHPHGVDGSLTTADGIRIVLFYSDGSNVGLGFDIKYATEVEGDGTFTSEWPTLVSESEG